jgi:hypothetical protein
MPTVSTMGLDIAKLVFQVHGMDANGLVVKAVRRRSRFELNSDQCRSFDTFHRRTAFAGGSRCSRRRIERGGAASTTGRR